MKRWLYFHLLPFILALIFPLIFVLRMVHKGWDPWVLIDLGGVKCETLQLSQVCKGCVGEAVPDCEGA
jgi:hypothetical protein